MLVEPTAAANPFASPCGFTVPKRPGETNEDCWQNSHKGAGAVSDGASISFDSAAWSRILARRFAQHPRFGREWLDEAIAAYGTLYDRDSLPWMQQAAFDRGSFASLLGVVDEGDGRVRLLAIGDSLAVLCDGDSVAASFPYTAPEQFDADPVLLSTNPAENVFLDEPGRLTELSVEWETGSLEAPALLCVSDALGRWILAERERRPSPISLLREVRTRRAFARLVDEERAAGRLRRDDTTMLAYWQWSAE